jgi:hypothetical protein
MSVARFKAHHIIDTNTGDRIQVPSGLKRGEDESLVCINGFEDVFDGAPSVLRHSTLIQLPDY